nr:helix-turn-helix transcriptional regulator [uncultured Albidiferax sp.]
MNFSERLTQERKRLKMSQAILGAHGGVAKLTQFSYEKGTSAPDAVYLAKVAEVGVDVLYVVTGQRMPVRQHIVTAVENDEHTVGSRPVVLLSERHQALIANYDAADVVGKRFIEGTADLAAKPETKVANKRCK